MMKATPHARTLLAAACIALAACQVGTSGTSGNLQFVDTTNTVPPDFTGLVDQPIAVGARLVLDVTLGDASGPDAVIATAVSDDPSILLVDSFSLGRVTVVGTSEGRAFLDVTTEDGIEDSLGLSVEAVADSEILLLPWGGLLRLPHRLWSQGAVLLPETSVQVFLRLTSARGTVLTGFGAVPLELGAATTATLEPDQASDFAVVTAGSAPETFELTTPRGDVLPLETVPESEIASLAIYDKSNEVGPIGDGDTLRLQASDQPDGRRSALLHLAAFTEDGRYVMGGGSAPLQIDIPAEDLPVIEVNIAPGPEQEADLNQILSDGRAFFLEAVAVGRASLTVEWAGLTITLPVEVVPAEAPSDGGETSGL